MSQFKSEAGSVIVFRLYVELCWSLRCAGVDLYAVCKLMLASVAHC